MPKQKTHSGIRKRVKVTAGGKLLRQKTGLRHNLESKYGKKKRELAAVRELSKRDTRTVLRMLGKR